MDSRHYNPTKLVAARELRNKTQQQIAQALNVDRQTVWRIESGKNISYELLAQACNLYGLAVTEVLIPYPELTKV